MVTTIVDSGRQHLERGGVILVDARSRLDVSYIGGNEPMVGYGDSERPVELRSVIALRLQMTPHGNGIQLCQARPPRR